MFTVSAEDIDKLTIQIIASLSVLVGGKITATDKTMTVGDDIPVLRFKGYWVGDTLFMELSINEERQQGIKQIFPKRHRVSFLARRGEQPPRRVSFNIKDKK